jgi:hypothetical protein
VLRDLGRAYGRRPGEEDGAAGTAYDYLDYCQWLNEKLEGSEGLAARAFWSSRLDVVPPALDLSRWPRRAPSPSSRGWTLFQVLDPDVGSRVRSVAAAAGVTPYVVLLTAFMTLVHAYADESDIAVAALGTTRRRAEFEDVVGHFVNPFVCRITLDGDASFRRVLHDVSDAVVDGLANGLFPFATVASEIVPTHDRNRAPVVTFAFGQDVSQDPQAAGAAAFIAGISPEPLTIGSLTMVPYAIQRRSVVYDLSAAVYESGDSVCIAWEWNESLGPRSAAERFMRNYAAILTECLAEPDRPLIQLSLSVSQPPLPTLPPLPPLPAGPPVRTWYERVLDQARHRSDADAVSGTLTALTFRQLLDAASVWRTRIPDSAARLDGSTVIQAAVAVLAAAGQGRSWGLESLEGRLSVVLGPAPTPPPAGRVAPADDRTVSPLGTPAWEALTTLAVPRTGPQWDQRVERSARASLQLARRQAVLIAVPVQNQQHSVLRILAALAAGASVMIAEDVKEAVTALSASPAAAVFVEAGHLAQILADPALSGVSLRECVAVVRGHVSTWTATSWDQRGGRLVGEVVCPESGSLVGIDSRPGAARGAIATIDHALGDILWSVTNRAGVPCPAGISGRLMVSELGDSGGLPAREGRARATGHYAHWQDDGTLAIVGEISRSHRVGRNRFQLEEIEAAIEGCPGVIAAEVRIQDGSRILAHVSGTGPAFSLDQVRTGTVSRLPGFMLPDEYVHASAPTDA